MTIHGKWIDAVPPNRKKPLSYRQSLQPSLSTDRQQTTPTPRQLTSPQSSFIAFPFTSTIALKQEVNAHACDFLLAKQAGLTIRRRIVRRQVELRKLMVARPRMANVRQFIRMNCRPSHDLSHAIPATQN